MKYIAFSNLAAAALFSPALWMRNAVDPIGWSWTQIWGAALAIQAVSTCTAVPDRRLRLPLLLLCAWASLSLFYSPNFHASLTGFYKAVYAAALVGLFAADRRRWLRAGGGAMLAWGAAGALLWLLVPQFRNQWINYPGLFAGFLALGGVLAAGRYLHCEGRVRTLYLVLAFLLAAVVVLVGSLGPFLAWLAGCGLQIFLAGKEAAQRKGLAFFCALILAPLLLSFVPSRSNRFHHLWYRKATDAFAGERSRIWRDSWSYFSSYKLRGSGLGSFRDVYPQYKSIPGLRNASHAHNEALTSLCELGLMGAVLFAWLAWAMLSRPLRDPGTWKDWGPWRGVLAAVCVQSLFDFNLRYPPILTAAILSLAPVLGTEEARPLGGARGSTAMILAALSAFLFSLPGAAYAVYEWSFHRFGDERQAARLALRLDPWNGHYLSLTGSLSDLSAAIGLEPRNVWYRRQAAQAFAREGARRRDPGLMAAAAEQYRRILELAPNVRDFAREAEAVERLRMNLD